MIVATGSQMDRIARCRASAALPQVFDANEDPSRDRGTAMHRFLERVAEVGREVALSEVDAQWRPFCEDIDIAKLADRLSLSTETALAYNWRRDTARLLQPVEHRAYEVDETCEVPLTIDVAGVSDDMVFAGDYKSGHGWLPEPHQSMQLGLGALALARLHAKNRAQVEYLRVRDDGSHRRFSATLDVFGLEAAAERVHNTMDEVSQLRSIVDNGTTPDVTEGPWCRFCPARQHCPAKVAIIRSVLHDPKAISLREALTPETAFKAYQLLRQAKDAFALIEGALYAYAKLDPIPLGVEEDGSLRFFGELRRPGNDRLDGAIVHQVVTELYGGEVADECVEMTATKAALTNAVRKVVPPGEHITTHTKKVLAMVDERHGISNPETVTTTEFTVSPEGETKARKRKAC